MKRNFRKKSLSALLALTLVLLPASYPSAKADTTSLNIPPKAGTTASGRLSLSDGTAVAENTKADTYDEVKKLAETKAALLTSIYGTTSVQYALIDNGQMVVSGQAGVYSKESNTPLSATKMYGIGSISKMFTTVAVMQLVDAGKVTLDTPVINYLPEFTMADSRYKDITVRMLLNHSSGLMGSNYRNAMLFNDNEFSTSNDLLAFLKTSRLKADPGEFSVYCNDGFSLAELLVEKVTGLSFTQYLKENISNPLGLSNTKTPKDDFQRNRLVKTYTKGIKYTLPVETVAMIGAGGIYSSAENLCRFSEIFMKNSASPVLSKTSAAAMEKEEYKNGFWPKDNDYDFAYGLGWDSVNVSPFNQYGIKALTKSGGTGQFTSNLIVLPEENMAVAVLASGGSGSLDMLLGQDILLAALKAKGSIDEIKPDKTLTKPVKASMPAEVNQYEGFYANSTKVYKVKVNQDSTLTLSNAFLGILDSQTFIYSEDGKFYSKDGSVCLSFIKESNGNTYIHYTQYTNAANLGQILSTGYLAQKLTDNPISPEIKSSWEKRIQKSYFIINEKYSSENYAMGSVFAGLALVPELNGYCAYAAIKDSNSARAELKIPGLNGRDLMDFTFDQKDGKEYLSFGGQIAIPYDQLGILPEESHSTIQINRDGYAKWYTIDNTCAGKTLKVTLPKKASFTVYDENGICLSCSYIKNEKVTLPSNGYVVFAGEPDAVFSIKVSK